MPLNTACVVATIGLALGGSIAIFSLVNAAWLRPIAVSDRDTLTVLYQTVVDASGNSRQSDVFRSDSLPTLDAALGGLVAGELSATDVTADFRPRLSLAGKRLLETAVVTPNYFDVLGVDVRGRSFSPTDNHIGAQPVAVISEAFWTDRLGRRDGVIGSSVSIGDQSCTIIGMVPTSFRGAIVGERIDVWLPFGVLPRFTGLPAVAASIAPVRVYVRLDGGVSLRQAQELAARALARPVTLRHFTGADPALSEAARLRSRQLSLLLLAATCVVLLVGCVNVASLMLTRSEARADEVSIRIAVGGTPWRLMRLLVTDTILLGASGALVAALVASWLLASLSTFRMPDGIKVERLFTQADWRVLTFAIVATSIVLLGPALLPRRERATTTGRRLFGGSRHTVATSPSLARQILVAAHVAMCLVLVAGALIFSQAIRTALTRHLGYAASQVLYVMVQPRLMQYSRGSDVDLQRRAADSQTLLERLRALPSVAGATNGQLPFSRNTAGPGVIEITTRDGMQPVRARSYSIGPHYFSVTGIALLAGRDFVPADSRDQPDVVIVSSEVAKALWPQTSGVGQVIRLGSGGPLEVIGVADEPVRGGLDSRWSALYLPSPIKPDRVAVPIVVRTRGDATSLVPDVYPLVDEVFPQANQVLVTTARQELDILLSGEWLGAWMLSLFGVISVALVAVGLYGTVSSTVTRRREELAIRIAVGAPSGRLLAEVAWQALSPVMWGCAAGSCAAIVLPSVLRAYVWGVGGLDVLSMAATVGIVFGIALFATLVAGRRVFAISPGAVFRTS